MARIIEENTKNEIQFIGKSVQDYGWEVNVRN